MSTGVDCSIKELTETVARFVGFDRKIVWDSSKPSGTPCNFVNVKDWPSFRKENYIRVSGEL